ncbi:MAG: aldehyde dehydrogenase EutE [Acidimicrobiia bacterium]|nr:aldehyde dehydrogenase EutE [Acidimicrobiia bacterium]MDX2467326.1 aldehyde dehydrogenase EutE [Acidimicrobiia bacterium]
MLNDHDVKAIIERVKGRVAAVDSAGRTGPALAASDELAAYEEQLGEGIYPTIDAAVAAARRSFTQFRDMGLDGRRKIVEAMRASMLREGERLAYMAREETGLGRADDKIIKNRIVTMGTPGPEDLEPHAVTGDDGMMVTEWAPYGVIGSISPTTNPTSTIINNSIAMIAAGNAVVFNVHPSAKRVSVENIKLLNRAIVSAGGPQDLITAIPNPTLESARAVMYHPDVRVLLVTGGPGVVKEALKTQKKAIAAGPGNPPAVVDQTADISKAGRDIVNGASFDNNIICIDEKTTIVVDTVADRLIQAMTAAGAYRLKEHELKRLERVIFTELGEPSKPGHINGEWIGKDAHTILGAIGVSVDPSIRLLIAEVPIEHSLVWTEQMMPVMPVVRVRDVDVAIDLAVRSEHGFRHTASIHSTNVATITKMARAMNCSIFVANGPNYAGLGEGGEGFTSFSIASPTGEGLTRPRTFSRVRRVTVVGALNYV